MFKIVGKSKFRNYTIPNAETVKYDGEEIDPKYTHQSTVNNAGESSFNGDIIKINHDGKVVKLNGDLFDEGVELNSIDLPAWLRLIRVTNDNT